MTARCNACGQAWPRDPALEVACPDCRAPAGSPCRRPSGHGCTVHAGRDRLAMKMGLLAPCPVTVLPAATDSSGDLPLFALQPQTRKALP